MSQTKPASEAGKSAIEKAGLPKKDTYKVQNLMKRAYRLPYTGGPMLGSYIDDEREKLKAPRVSNVPSVRELTREQLEECLAVPAFVRFIDPGVGQKLRVF